MTTRRRLTWVMAGVLICTAGVVTLQWTGHGPQVLLARYLGGHLGSVPDERVPEELQQLAELDEVGLLVLVDSLGSERARVAQSAAATLDQQLDRWRDLPRDQSSRRVAGLARNLARRVDRWPAGARSAASDLALRILDWPIDGRHVDRAALVADCEHVLRTRGTDIRATPPAPERSVRRSATDTHVASNEAGPQPEVDLDASAIPGGNLPIDEVEFPPPPSALTTIAEPGSVGQLEPTLLPTPQLHGTLSRGHLSDEPATADTQPADSPPAETESTGLSPIRPLSNEAPTPADADLDSLPDLALFSYLDGRDTQRTTRAEDLLKRRGYGTSDLTLARTLVGPDVAARRRLVDTVAQLPHAAGRWLVWLSRDRDPSVREAAVSLMVTAQDPRVQRRLLEMETEESDEHIQDQLRRWRETLGK